MNGFVECWHCEHYIWFSATSDNSFAKCKINGKLVFARNKVCEQFLLKQRIHTQKDIPSYCTHYKNK